MLLTCSSCGKKVEVPPRLEGKRVVCPNCKVPLQVPRLTEKPDSNESSQALRDQPATPKGGPPSRRYGKSGRGIVDFLVFRRMVAPVIIMIVFYFSVLVLTVGTFGSIALVWTYAAAAGGDDGPNALKGDSSRPYQGVTPGDRQPPETLRMDASQQRPAKEQHRDTSPWGLIATLYTVIALILWPIEILTSRLFCEVIMVAFRINETLTDMLNQLRA